MMKRCLVFGGSGALGRVVCETLAAQGARLAFTYRNGESVAREMAAKIPGSLSLRVDLTSVREIEAAIDRVAKEFGGIDAFIQCAAVGVTVEGNEPGLHQRMPDVDEAAWGRMMDVNARSSFFAVRRLAGFMRDANVVLVGSIDGVKPVPAPVHYAASKAAMLGMTRAMAKELGASGIRVNMVAPGILDGGLSRDIPPDMLKEYVKHCGLRRVGRMAEVAGTVAWLALENTYVTGQCLLIDGGL